MLDNVEDLSSFVLQIRMQEISESYKPYSFSFFPHHLIQENALVSFDEMES
jgi:hypothetical protein